MPGGPSMTSTPPRPCTSAVTNAPITFNSPARPRIGGVTSWPPPSNRPVGGPTGGPVYRLLTAAAVHVIVGVRPRRPPDLLSIAQRAPGLGQRLGADSRTRAADDHESRVIARAIRTASSSVRC